MMQPPEKPQQLSSTGSQALPALPGNESRGRESFSADDSAASHGLGPKTTPDPRAAAGQQFSLATLLLVTALVAVCLALFRAAPILGVIYLLLAVPAFVRTLLLAQREKGHGGRLTAAEKVAVFLGSIAVVVLVTLVSLVTGALVFLAGLALAMLAQSLTEGGMQEGMLGIGILVTLAALIVGMVTAWRMFRVSWPSREAFVEQLHRGDIVQLDRPRHPGDRSE